MYFLIVAVILYLLLAGNLAYSAHTGYRAKNKEITDSLITLTLIFSGVSFVLGFNYKEASGLGYDIGLVVTIIVLTMLLSLILILSVKDLTFKKGQDEMSFLVVLTIGLAPATVPNQLVLEILDHFVR